MANKMKYNLLLNNIKDLIGMDVQMAAMKSQDGSISFEAESFEAGFSVGIVSPDGIVPVPVGDYVLEDGRTMRVEQEGVIAEIVEAQPEEAPQMEEAPQEVAEEPKVEATPKRVVESVSKETFFEAIEMLKSSFEARLSALENPIVEEKEEEVKPLVVNPERVELSTQEMPKTYSSIEAQIRKNLNK